MKPNTAALAVAVARTATVETKKFIVPAQHFTKR